MTTLQDARSVLEKVHQLDAHAGKALLGDASHIRGELGSFYYALSLAVRVVLVGAAAAFLVVMLATVAQFNAGQLTFWAAIGYGVLLYLISGYIYPANPVMHLPIAVTIALASIYGLGVAHSGLTPNEAFLMNPFPELAARGFGFLLGCFVLQSIGGVIATAFKEPPPTYRPAWRAVKSLMTDQERVEYEPHRQRDKPLRIMVMVFAGAMIVLLWGGFIALLVDARHLGMTAVAGALVLCAIYLVFAIPAWIIERPAWQFQQKVIRRLRSEGILYDTFDRQVTVVETQNGYVLNGVVYPKGKATRSESKRKGGD